MTNLHARTVMSRPHAQLNRPFRFNPSPQTQATGNQIFPARTWTFSAQPWDTAPRTAISPVINPAVPVMPIPNLADYGIVSGGTVRRRNPNPNPPPETAEAHSLGSRLVSWMKHLGG